MNKGFERFKSKLRRGAFFRSLVLGLSCGVLLAATYMTIQKQRTFAPDLLWTLAIGGGCALLVTLVAFWIMCPSEKKIAKKLDEDLGLGEKVQTMLAYREHEGIMFTLQREDANHRLEETPSRAVKYRHPWKHIIAPMLACALMVVAVVTPIKAVPPTVEPEEPTFEMGTWQEAALAELIEKVKTSEMEAIPKATIVNELEALLSNLKSAGLKVSEMKQLVVSAIVTTNRAVKDANTSDELNRAMAQNEVQFVSNLGIAIGILNGLQTQKVINTARENMRVDELDGVLTETMNAFNASLEDLDEDLAFDAAYASLTQFVKKLSTLKGEMGEYSRNWAQEQLDDIFDTLAKDLNQALLQQHTNKETGEMVVKTLMTIFELTAEDIPPEEQPDQTPDGSQDNQKPEVDEDLKDVEGAVGDKETLFGSDDTIFDPTQNQQVKYGDVILEYYKTVSEKTLDGNLTEELEQFISNYFTTLFDGSESKKSGN